MDADGSAASMASLLDLTLQGDGSPRRKGSGSGAVSVDARVLEALQEKVSTLEEQVRVLSTAASGRTSVASSVMGEARQVERTEGADQAARQEEEKKEGVRVELNEEEEKKEDMGGDDPLDQGEKESEEEEQRGNKQEQPKPNVQWEAQEPAGNGGAKQQSASLGTAQSAPVSVQATSPYSSFSQQSDASITLLEVLHREREQCVCMCVNV